MPLFVNRNTDPVCYALVSYKCLYSKFSGSEDWRGVSEYFTPRLLLHKLVRTPGAKLLIVMRNPYERTVSCFKDKYRKQPTRIHEANFEWQYCHDLVFQQIGVRLDASDEEKAAALLELSFQRFMKILPKIYMSDGHFSPQYWALRIHWAGRRLPGLGRFKVVHMENPDELETLPSLEFSVFSNSTKHISADFDWDEESRAIVQKLYHKDFILGGYSCA
ncbi:sulfotransferase family 2 domain-containing protein [Cerasicoccus maritimus]|uniref:sulfotransferase family 2 domain-containing protein n=1 Tax=Cerasicoccus maritimus TaxID=490089 RepID=UPI002852C838|nr:sulfotransferase family 2 domain-containing protein [Cerasicoccus maritimus]